MNRHHCRKFLAALFAAALAIPVAAQELPKTTIAILPFSTDVLCEDNGKFKGFGELFAGDLAITLSELSTLTVLDRNMLDPVLKELALQRDAESFFDTEAVVQRTKLMLVDFLLHGSAIVLDPMGNSVSVNLRMMEKNTGRIVFSKSLSGSAANLFDKSGELSAMFIVAMKAKLSKEEEARTFPAGRALYEALLREGPLTERIAALETVLHTDSDDKSGDGSAIEGWRVLAALYREAGEPQKAFQAAAKVLAAAPTDQECTFLAGALAFEGGLRKEAEQMFTRTEKANYRRIDSIYHLALLKEIGSDGQKFSQGSDIPAAQAFYKAALKLDPRHAPSLFNLGYSYFALAAREKKVTKGQYELIKAEVETFLLYLDCAPAEDAARVKVVREQVEQHKNFLLAWEKANKQP